jgi:hypothetical protein
VTDLSRDLNQGLHHLAAQMTNTFATNCDLVLADSATFKVAAEKRQRGH